jgi:hypothetical protein
VKIAEEMSASKLDLAFHVRGSSEEPYSRGSIVSC